MRSLQYEIRLLNWLHMVVYHGGYTEIDKPHIINQIFNYIADFVSGILTREQFWILAKFKRPTNQMCFCTTRALEFLAFTGSEVL